MVEQAFLEGFGAGVSFSLAAEIPVNFSFSTPKAPGGGTYILVGPNAPDPVPASYFEGLCLIYSADAIYGFLDKSSSIVIFLPLIALALPSPLIAAMVKGAGLIEGLGFTSTAAGVSAGVLACWRAGVLACRRSASDCESHHPYHLAQGRLNRALCPAR